MPLNRLTPTEQANFLKLVLDSTIEGFYSIDTEGNTTLCNVAFLRMLGYESASEVIGRKLHGEIHHSHPNGTHYDVSDCPIYQAASLGIQKRVLYELFYRKDGSSFPVEYRADPIYRDGKLEGAVCTFTDISEQLEHAKALSKYQTIAQSALERIELALNSGAILGTWVWDIPANNVIGDERFMRTFSLNRDVLETGVPIETAMASIHPEDAARVHSAISETLVNGGGFRTEYRVRVDNGDWLWLEANGTVEVDANGQPSRFPGVLIDIDERKKVESALRATHDQLKLAQKAGGIGVFTIRQGASQMAVSGEFCAIFGLPVRDSIPVSEAEQCCVPEDRHIQSNHENRFSGTAPLDVEYRIRRQSDGELRWIARRAEFISDAKGKLVQMVGTVQDVTDRKQSDILLLESQEHLSLMLESAKDYAIISLNEQGHIVIWNTGAERIFGYAPDDVLGQHIEVIFTPEDCAYNAPQHELATAAEKGRASDERWHMRKNGERFYASGTMAAMYDEKRQVKGFVKIARDMTQEQYAQEALLEARNAAEAANIAKTEFLANMSHEIRTPMNAIIGLSNILAMSQPLSPKQRDFIKTLQGSADSLLTLINDLLDIAKIEARTVELEQIPFSVARIMQEVVSMMAVQAKDKGLNFTGNADCVLNRMFVGDPTRLRQIILNLCSNAIKFTDQGGVDVSIDCVPTIKPAVDNIIITVKDSGIGIASDKLDTIFQKFMQADTSINRKYGGTGLGLAITKTLAEIMDGSITVESALGTGSQFTVTIPLAHATDEGVAEAEYSISRLVESSIEKTIRPHVLLVEDYEPNILVASTFLEQFGYLVDVAKNGMEAFEKVRDGNYVVALMDVQMHGMNGLEATRLIREYEKQQGKAHLPIIGMTAHAMAGDRERCLGVGMDDYIAKPFNPDELREKLKIAIQVDA